MVWCVEGVVWYVEGVVWCGCHVWAVCVVGGGVCCVWDETSSQ